MNLEQKLNFKNTYLQLQTKTKSHEGSIV